MDSYCRGRRSFGGSLLFYLAVIIFASRAASAEAPSAVDIKPYRVLLVVEHRSDPYGLIVGSESDKFQPVAALLKSWSVPFDILRLEQQHLDASYLFRRMGELRYGTVIWLADQSAYERQDLLSLEQATQAGTGLIVVNSRLLDSTLAKLLGLRFKELYTSTSNFQIVHEHYITSGMAPGDGAKLVQSRDYSDRIWVEPTSAEVLLAQEKHPILTVNQLGLSASALWLGAPNLSLLSDSVFWRNLFFRSLVWSLGYIVVPNVDYAHRVSFELDDWGTADKGFPFLLALPRAE